MKIKNAVSKKNLTNKTFVSIMISVFATAALALAMLSVGYSLMLLVDEIHMENARLYANLTFAFLTMVYAFQIIKLWKTKRKYKYYLYIVASLLTTIFFAIFGLNPYTHRFLIAAYFATILAGQVISVIFDHRKRSIVISALLVVIAGFLFVFTLKCGDTEALYETLAMLLISANCIGFILIEALAKIQLAKLTTIIRKTYALEIILGLVSLIISFSFVFMIIEGMPYEDALWYCFAIVTTIGFGDINATSIIGRILSVILGLYGIVVVAVITSIIVNFYNETRYIGKKENPEEEQNESSEEPNEEEKKDENN